MAGTSRGGRRLRGSSRGEPKVAEDEDTALRGLRVGTQLRFAWRSYGVTVLGHRALIPSIHMYNTGPNLLRAFRAKHS